MRLRDDLRRLLSECRAALRSFATAEASEAGEGRAASDADIEQMGHDDAFDRQVLGWVNSIRAKVRTGAKPPGDISDLSFLLHEHRLIKSDAEIRVMQRAADISSEAHSRAMRESTPGRYEYHLESAIQHNALQSPEDLGTWWKLWRTETFRWQEGPALCQLMRAVKAYDWRQFQILKA